jgi:sugar lactone lactonase YvrE
MKKFIYTVLVVFFLSASFLSGWGRSEKKTPETAPSSSAESAAPAAPAGAPPEKSWAGSFPAPEFPPGMEWFNVSEGVTMSSLKGKIVLMDFWTYGCINCIHNMPYLKLLQEEFADELVIVGVHSAKFSNEGKSENLRNIILRYGITYPVVNDSEFVVWNTWGARAWPTLALVDPAGNLVGGTTGEGFYDTFRDVIRSLVKEFDRKKMLDRASLAVKLEKESKPSTLLSFPGKVRVDSASGRLFLADSGHNRIIIAEIETGTILDIAGSGQGGFADGTFEEARFKNPQGMALSEDGKILYVADTENHSIRALDLSARRVSTAAGTGRQAEAYPPEPGTGTGAALSSPWDLLREGRNLYIAMAGSHQLWFLDLPTGKAAPLAGSGAEGVLDAPGADAELAQPSGLALSPERRLYFADSEASTIRWVDLGVPNKPVGTLAGSGKDLFDFGADDGKGNAAKFQHPLGVAWLDGMLYVVDTYNHRIRRIDPKTAEVTTLAGTAAGYGNGKQGLFNEPGGIDAARGKLYIADTNNHSLRVYDIASRETRSLVLKGYEKFAGDFVPKGEGRLILERVDLAPGRGEIRITVDLPKGYKPNPDASSAFSVRTEGRGLLISGAAAGGGAAAGKPVEKVLAGPKFPIGFPAEFTAGSGTLFVDITLIYCEEEKETLCFLERKTLEVPYRVIPGRSSSNFDIRYSVTP